MTMKCPTSLPPIVRWPGGKTRMTKRLIGMFPKHETYVEPFAGGASVFFAKPLAKKNVVADADKWIIDLYEDVKKGKLAQCSGGIKVSRGLFKRSQAKKSACMKVALTRLSYQGDRKTYGPDKKYEGRTVLTKKLSQHECYAAKLKKATLKSGDFAKTMRASDSVNTLHFLDPPWPMDYSDKYHAHGGPKRGKSKSSASFKGAMDPRHVKKVADSMKGTVVVIYNWTPELARIFKGPGWTVKKIGALTQPGTGGSVVRPNLVAIKKAKRK